jgi:hypothetical protein
MRRPLTIICILAIISCEQPANTGTVDENTMDNTTNIEKVSTVDQDCVFDLTTQTAEFIQEIPDYSNYIWDDQTKTATVLLDNGDTIKLTRGGCVHFNYYIQLITKTTDSLTINNPDFGLDLAKELAQKVFPKPDYQLIDSLVTNKLYEDHLTDFQYYFNLTQDMYCDMTIIMQETESGQFRLEIGYYLC